MIYLNCDLSIEDAIRAGTTQAGRVLHPLSDTDVVLLRDESLAEAATPYLTTNSGGMFTTPALSVERHAWGAVLLALARRHERIRKIRAVVALAGQPSPERLQILLGEHEPDLRLAHPPADVAWVVADRTRASALVDWSGEVWHTLGAALDAVDARAMNVRRVRYLLADGLPGFLRGSDGDDALHRGWLPTDLQAEIYFREPDDERSADEVCVQRVDDGHGHAQLEEYLLRGQWEALFDRLSYPEGVTRIDLAVNDDRGHGYPLGIWTIQPEDAADRTAFSALVPSLRQSSRVVFPGTAERAARTSLTSGDAVSHLKFRARRGDEVVLAVGFRVKHRRTTPGGSRDET
jgi:hypothetical protein